MPIKSKDLRKEAARYLEAAKNTKHQRTRDELMRLADKYLELANSAAQKEIDEDRLN
jgi:hypothetical protein